MWTELKIFVAEVRLASFKEFLIFLTFTKILTVLNSFYIVSKMILCFTIGT